MNQGLDEGLREPITPKGLEKGRPGYTIKSLVKINIKVVSTTSAILQGLGIALGLGLRTGSRWCWVRMGVGGDPGGVSQPSQPSER